MISSKGIMRIALAATLAFGAIGTAAQATTVHATNVVSYTQGTNTMMGGVIAPDRLVTANALGTADGNFLSLGFGGEVILGFGQRFTGPMQVFEITFGRRASHVERLQVFGGINGVFAAFLGTVSNTTGTDFLNFSGIFDQLRLVDVSPVAANRDGFDIDAIGVSPVPLPAAGWLLLAALGAAAALRRRPKPV